MVLSYLSPGICTSVAVLFSLVKENNFIVQFAWLLLAATDLIQLVNAAGFTRFQPDCLK